MSLLEPLRRPVQDNCDIADARHAAGFTLCVYLLKMREYFRWEQGFALSDSLPREALGDWIAARERCWERLDGEDYLPLVVEGRQYDPFDAEAVNAALLPRGIVYSAGLGLGQAAHFFLGRLEGRAASGDGATVYRAGEEYARDLGAPVAMTQGAAIFVRRESVRRMLWERVQEWRWDRRDNALGAALACYPFERDADAALEAMVRHELPNIVRHERGERTAGRILGRAWGAQLCRLPQRAQELGLRAARDHLADCLALLPALLESRDRASLLLYRAGLAGLRGQLFPALRGALDRWAECGDLEPVRAAARTGEAHWRAQCLRLRDAAAEDVDAALEQARL